jgi:hypothetical protein
MCCCLSLTRGHDDAVPTLRTSAIQPRQPVNSDVKPSCHSKHVMQPKRIKQVSAGLLLSLAAASYAWPGFGVVFLCSSVILLGCANNLLSIQSKRLGLVTGGAASVLAFATSAGAGLSPLQLILFTVFGAIAGYGFAAMPVGSGDANQTEEQEEENPPSKNKSGGGGDFSGGGSSEKY